MARRTYENDGQKVEFAMDVDDSVSDKRAGWRADQVVDVSALRAAFPGDEYGRDLAQLCDDVTEAIRTAEEPPAPPKEPLADLELLPPKLIERLAAAAGRGREL